MGSDPWNTGISRVKQSAILATWNVRRIGEEGSLKQHDNECKKRYSSKPGNREYIPKPKHDLKLIFRRCKCKIGKKAIYPVIGKYRNIS